MFESVQKVLSGPCIQTDTSIKTWQSVKRWSHVSNTELDPRKVWHKNYPSGCNQTESTDWFPFLKPLKGWSPSTGHLSSRQWSVSAMEAGQWEGALCAVCSLWSWVGLHSPDQLVCPHQPLQVSLPGVEVVDVLPGVEASPPSLDLQQSVNNIFGGGIQSRGMRKVHTRSVIDAVHSQKRKCSIHFYECNGNRHTK